MSEPLEYRRAEPQRVQPATRIVGWLAIASLATAIAAWAYGLVSHTANANIIAGGGWLVFGGGAVVCSLIYLTLRRNEG